MSLRAVKSPLAPKMTMAHGSTALRPNSSRQVNNSSKWSACSIDATQWRSRLGVSTTLVARAKGQSHEGSERCANKKEGFRCGSDRDDVTSRSAVSLRRLRKNARLGSGKSLGE